MDDKTILKEKKQLS